MFRRENGAASKCVCQCSCGRSTYPRSSSAKASSIWNIRNDSSNVSSLLAPDSFNAEDNSDASTTNKTNRTILSKTNYKRTIKSAAPVARNRSADEWMHCESCYCRDNPTLPLLDFKSRNYNGYDGSGIKRDILRRRQNINSHGVRRISRGQEPTKIAQDKSKTFCKDDLGYTHARNGYELKMGELHKISEVEDERTESTEKECQNGEKETRESPEAYGDIQTEDYDRLPRCYRDFKELAKFRKDNYFETHSSNQIAGPDTRTDHKCVHKFVINDRFLPEPLNPDSFGVSRCDACNKPMENFKSQKPPTQRKTHQANKVKQIYEYNLTPPRLNIGCGREIVQIKVPERLGKECLWGKSEFCLNRRGPGNSYALRYQKGRL